jgi:chemotaxis protein methyltransferase CheR
MVKFAPLNLADLAYPRQENDTQSMDLILCRNVLMYFTPALMRRVVLGLHQALVEGGLLSVSATELGARAFDVLVPVRSGGVVFYRKAGPTASVEESRAVGSPQATPRSQPLQDSATHDDAAHRAPPPNDAESVTPSGVLQLAWEHANAGRLEIALTVVEDALSVAKLDAGAHHLHAAILQELGRYAPARAALKRALYLEPDFVLAHHALGQLALRDERPDEAGRHFGNALSLLARMLPDEIVPRADGMAAGQLKALIETALALERHS